VAHRSNLGTAYNEEAFRYFLAVERERARSARTSLLLVLIKAKKQAGMNDRIAAASAARIFAAMWLCFRDVDFTGWFRQGRIAGAVLTHVTEPPSPLVALMIEHRIAKTLAERVPGNLSSCLRVRVLQLGAAPKC
jgi:hypothetical protein